MHIKRNDHLKAARMLIRVANNISKFPSRMLLSQFLTFLVLSVFHLLCLLQNSLTVSVTWGGLQAGIA